MNPLRIVVCLKVVPRPEEVRIDPETLTLQRAGVRSMINPADLSALELALRLKDLHGGEVRLVSMGPPFVEEQLRDGLAMGADAADLLSDRAFGGADTLATSYVLARAIDALGIADLVVCGEESSDGATAQVPPGIAEWLGWAQATGVTEAALLEGGERLWVRRELGGGHEVLTARLPAVISVRVGAVPPRFLDMERRGWANTVPISVRDAAALDVDEEAIGAAGSPTTVAGTREAAQRERRRERIPGSPSEQARVLAERLGLTAGRARAARADAVGAAAVPANGPTSASGTDGPAPAPALTTATRLTRAERAAARGASGPL